MSAARDVGLREPSLPAKPWWQSRTIIGIAVMVLSQILRSAKVDIVDAELTDMLTLALDTCGAALAIYGRIDARKSLKLTMPGGPFNPKAPVKKASRPSTLDSRRSGFINWSALIVFVGIAAFWCAVTAAAVHLFSK